LLRAVIFDFDLTLADSRAGVTDSVNHALRRLGLPEAEPEAIHRTIGLPLPRAFEQLTGAADPRTDEFCKRFAARADQVMVEGTRMFPEVPDVLAWLRSRDVRTAVVSTKFRYRIEAILGRYRLRHQFDVIVGDAEAAAAAQLRFVAVLSGSSLREEFAGWPVDRFLGSLRELVACADGG
jgi:phosphoglycolate phosphatase